MKTLVSVLGYFACVAALIACDLVCEHGGEGDAGPACPDLPCNDTGCACPGNKEQVEECAEIGPGLTPWCCTANPGTSCADSPAAGCLPYQGTPAPGMPVPPNVYAWCCPTTCEDAGAGGSMGVVP